MGLILYSRAGVCKEAIASLNQLNSYGHNNVPLFAILPKLRVILLSIMIFICFISSPSHAVENIFSNTFAYSGNDGVCFNTIDKGQCGASGNSYDRGVAIIPTDHCGVIFSSSDPIPDNAPASLASAHETNNGASGIVNTLTFGIPGTNVSPTTSDFCLVKDGAGGFWSLERSAVSNGNDGGINACTPTDNFDPAIGCSSAASIIVSDAQKVISTFMQNRANHILSNQPSLSRFATGASTENGSQGFSLTGNESSAILAFSTSINHVMRRKHTSNSLGYSGPKSAETFGTFSNISNAAVFPDIPNGLKIAGTPDTSKDTLYGYETQETQPKFDLWTQVYGSRSRSGKTKSDLWVGYLGAQYAISPDLLIGGIVQLDWANEKNSATNSKAEGNGWMIGPYLAGRAPDQNLFFETRAAWGRSQNTVSPIGTYTDKFETERWMVSAKVNGSYDLNEYIVEPTASLAWFREKQKAYTDSLNSLQPSQTISLGEFRFGPKIKRTYDLGDGDFVTPTVGISGVVNFDVNNNAASQGFALSNRDLRARFDIGLSKTQANGTTLSFSSFYDGLGVSNYDAWGGSFKLTLPLN